MSKANQKSPKTYDPVVEARKTLRSYALCQICGTHMLGIMKNPKGSPARSICDHCDPADCEDDGRAA